VKTYIVIHEKQKSPEEFRNYHSALITAVMACDIDYPSIIMNDGVMIHRFIIDCFGRMVDTISVQGDVK
jgi:hypothetical protein